MKDEAEVTQVLVGWIIYDQAETKTCLETFAKTKAAAKKLWGEKHRGFAKNYESANLKVCQVFAEFPGEKW